MIPAGKFDKRIWLRLLGEQPDGDTGVEEQELMRRQLWAKHEPVHGLVLRAGAQTSETPTDLFYIRSATGTRVEEITVEHEVLYRGHRYRVMDAIDLEGRRQVTRLSVKDLGVFDG